MASLQADPSAVKEVTKKPEETTHDHVESAAVEEDEQDLAAACKDIEEVAGHDDETDHKPKEVVLPDDIEEDSEVLVADQHGHEEDKAAVSPIEEDSKWTDKIEHDQDQDQDQDQDEEDDEDIKLKFI